MKIEYTEVYGFKASMRGMRNPLDSWDKSDSTLYPQYNQQRQFYYQNPENFVLGFDDKTLAQNLTKAGSEHCKFLRQIHVWVDLTSPRYIWSEFDTYKYNTKNSCSTMHTAHKRNLTHHDFELPIPHAYLQYLNTLIFKRKEMAITASDFIHEFKNALPEGFLQKRTVDTNYAELLNIYKQRRNHRLKQWHEICDWIETLPYFKELTGIID